MTLNVQVYTRNEDGTMNFIKGSASEELAGFERCRQTLWGAKEAIGLGLSLLPSLAHGDLYVENDDLVRLENEANLLLSHLDLLNRQTEYPVDFIRLRTQNILMAVLRARQLQGGVVIW